MAPLPSNLTNVMFFDYVTGNEPTSQEHTVQVRYNPAGADVSDVQAAFLALLNAFLPGNFRTGWRVLRVRVREAGEVFSLPVTMISSLAAFVGTSTASYVASREAVELSWQGRSIQTGRRVDLSLYTGTTDVNANFRYTPTSSTIVAPTVAALNSGAGSGIFITADGTSTVWYSYFNANYNSYWERRLRSV